MKAHRNRNQGKQRGVASAMRKIVDMEVKVKGGGYRIYTHGVCVFVADEMNEEG